jgi:Spy/CpxP family protein refolding chaperone
VTISNANRSKQVNKLMISVITTLLLAASGMAVAQDGGPGPGNKGQRPHHAKQAPPRTMMEGVMRAINRLDLSDEQKEGIWATVHNLKGQLHPIVIEMKSGQEELRGLINATNYDAKAVAALAKKEGELTEQRILLTSEAVANVLGQLTQEQRAELDAMKAERKQRAKDKRGKKRVKPAEPQTEAG